MQHFHLFIRGKITGILLLLMIAGVAPLAAQQGASAEDLKKANNPLANMIALNFQNYYTPRLYGLSEEMTNIFWIRYAQPIGKVLVRASLPANTFPAGQADPESGLGNFNIFLKPQFTMLHDRVGQPAFQVFTALNMQFITR